MLSSGSLNSADSCLVVAEGALVRKVTGNTVLGSVLAIKYDKEAMVQIEDSEQVKWFPLTDLEPVSRYYIAHDWGEGYCNVRAAPDMRAEVIGMCRDGDCVEVVSRRNKFLGLASGGWVRKEGIHYGRWVPGEICKRGSSPSSLIEGDNPHASSIHSTSPAESELAKGKHDEQRKLAAHVERTKLLLSESDLEVDEAIRVAIAMACTEEDHLNMDTITTYASEETEVKVWDIHGTSRSADAFQLCSPTVVHRLPTDLQGATPPPTAPDPPPPVQPTNPPESDVKKEEPIKVTNHIKKVRMALPPTRERSRNTAQQCEAVTPAEIDIVLTCALDNYKARETRRQQLKAQPRVPGSTRSHSNPSKPPARSALSANHRVERRGNASSPASSPSAPRAPRARQRTPSEGAPRPSSPPPKSHGKSRLTPRSPHFPPPPPPSPICGETVGSGDTLVNNWLATHSLEGYSHIFQQHEVDAVALAMLTEQDLHEMGLPLDVCKTISAAITAENGALHSTPLKPLKAPPKRAKQ